MQSKPPPAYRVHRLNFDGKRKWTVGEPRTVSDVFDISIDAVARRRELEPVPGGGAHLYGVGSGIRGLMAGPTGLEPA